MMRWSMVELSTPIQADQVTLMFTVDCVKQKHLTVKTKGPVLAISFWNPTNTNHTNQLKFFCQNSLKSYHIM